MVRNLLFGEIGVYFSGPMTVRNDTQALVKNVSGQNKILMLPFSKLIISLKRNFGYAFW